VNGGFGADVLNRCARRDELAAWGLSDAMQARGWEYETRLTGVLNGICGG
jgi:hypothetical protein